MKYLQQLNQKQKEGVRSNHQRTLLLAGAGSGKTRVLTRRIIKHIVEDNIPKSKILALTFTNKAAREMKERLDDLMIENEIPAGGGTVFAGTFHSFCVRVLQKNYMYASLSKGFSILDPDGQKSVMRDILNIAEENQTRITKKKDLPDDLKKEKLAEIKTHFKVTRAKIKEALSIIDHLKNDGIPPSGSYPYFCDLFPDSGGSEGEKLYRHYETYKHRHNMLDFNDLIIRTIIALGSSKELRIGVQSTFAAILVDEFQDTNALQIRLLKLIESPTCITTVVGDDDQSIYEWRGAKIENILNYPEHSNAKVVMLEENYRSTQTILKAANAVVKKNENRMGKNLWTSNKEGELITEYHAKSAYDEAEWVTARIAKLIQHGVKESDIAILYRNNSISSLLEIAMYKNNQSYVIHGGINFWMRKEVKAVMSFVKWLVDDNNNTAIKEALSYQGCGYGEKTHAKLTQSAMQNNTSLESEIIDYVGTGSLNKNKEAMANTIEIVQKLRAIPKMDIFTIIDSVIIHTNILKHFERKEENEKYVERYDNIQALLCIARDFAYIADCHEEFIPDSKLDAFLQSSALQIEEQTNISANQITMMTVHASKGLEFEHVIIVGMDDGVFPSFSAINRDYFEEERRLAYVAITRAMKTLAITTSPHRAGRPPMEPSRFLGDIPNACKVKVSREKSQKPWF